MSTASRHVIVTGGSKGLGLGFVQAYLDAGERVVTCARKITPELEALLADPAYGDRLHFIAHDLTDRPGNLEFVKAAIERFGPIDVLVNNAGIGRAGILGLFTDEEIDAVLDLNLRGSIHLTKQVVRNMLAHGRGWIVNVTSIVGQSGYLGLTVYSATKAGLDGFTRALSREVGPKGLIVNSVAPGYLRTEMSSGFSDSQVDQIVRRTPAGRLAEPEDVARAVLFLTDESNTFIMGQVLVVDGGLIA